MPLVPFQRAELESPARARFELARSVRLQDVDAAGVVFYAAAFELFSDAFLAWCGSVGWPIERMLGPGGVALPVRHAEADFLAPLALGDRLAVGIVGCRAGEGELRVGYRVDRRRPGQGPRAAIVGQTRHVCVEAATFTRTPLPPDLARALVAAPDA